MSAGMDTGQPPPNPDGESRKSPSSPTKRSNLCGWKCFAILPILVIAFFYTIPFIVAEYEGVFGYGFVTTYDDIPLSFMNAFRSYDINFDGYIDPHEFIQIAQELSIDTSDDDRRLNKTNRDIFEFIDTTLSENVEVVTVIAEMEPLDLTTMTKFQGEQESLLGEPAKYVPGLAVWKKPHVPAHVFNIRNFEIFLPGSNYPGNGKPYYIIGSDYADRYASNMNYYHPLEPNDNEKFLQALLSMLHPNAFVNCRFGPRGTVALVRAENDEYYDIVIRTHAEFQLNERPNFPFWFTPGQFMGRLIISKDASHLEYFEMKISTAKSLNIDMEWMTSKDNNEVDIGFMPKLKLFAPAPSTLFDPESLAPSEVKPFDFDKFKWNFEMSVEEGISIIEKKMYPFKEISYLDYLDAFETAKQENKLVHFIMLWGALDDQSC